jgi:hypothetical protein
MHCRTITVVALAAFWSLTVAAKDSNPNAKPEQPTPSIETKTASMRHMPGLFALDWDDKSGRLFLEIPRFNEDFLYIETLPYGVGSSDLGLDRGEVSNARVVRFERFGPKILLVQPNEDFRSSSSDPAEQLSVLQSFPESVLAGFTVAAEDPLGKDKTVLVDATDFFQRDAHNVAESLSKSHQDAYKLDSARSAIALDGTRAFPRNIEVESILTFSSDTPEKSKLVDEVTPDAHALTVREHQSFLALPGPGFVARRFDPRAGYFGRTYRDYSAPLGQPVDQQLILRHRLIKKDPACISACVAQQPIQYYVDRAAPEPIRSALVEGASWWDDAFQAAGWAPGTFRVDVLPEGADPMDIRYNVIQWVHRFTRGWSIGWPIADPRTGEIIKGNVTLGSLRGRQDYLIAEALLSPYRDNREGAPQDDPILKMVLARLRLLAAHETGHTLGLAHNFAASSFPHAPSESVSVMDYPHPWITLDGNGAPDISRAYSVGIGQWDKVAITYGYRQFADQAEESTKLDEILSESARTGLMFITDADTRPPGSAHPYASTWDNGTSAAEELERIMGVRAAALTRFGENAIRRGTAMAQLEDTLVPLYLLHRYQTEAAVKEIGGLDYRYQLRGGIETSPTIVRPGEQNKALKAIAKTLTPEFLVLPESILKLLPPRPPGLPRTRESFPANTGPTFDPIATAECAADLALAGLFNAQRASRLVEYHARDPENPSFTDVIDAVFAASGTGRVDSGRLSDSMVHLVQRAVYVRTVEALLTLAADPHGSTEVRAIAYARLRRIQLDSNPKSITDSYLSRRIDLFMNDPTKFDPAPPVQPPPGMPIGDD